MTGPDDNARMVCVSWRAYRRQLAAERRRARHSTEPATITPGTPSTTSDEPIRRSDWLNRVFGLSAWGRETSSGEPPATCEAELLLVPAAVRGGLPRGTYTVACRLPAGHREAHQGQLTQVQAVSPAGEAETVEAEVYWPT